MVVTTRKDGDDIKVIPLEEYLKEYDALPWYHRRKLRSRWGRFTEFFKMAPYHVKWRFQSIFRGYSDPDIWNLDDSFYAWIVPRLKAFLKQEDIGMPVLYGYDYEVNMFLDADGALVPPEAEGDLFAEWRGVLEDILAGFECALEGDLDADAKIARAHQLFAKYCGSLWT